jgi:hypothetical protein
MTGWTAPADEAAKARARLALRADSDVITLPLNVSNAAVNVRD